MPPGAYDPTQVGGQTTQTRPGPQRQDMASNYPMGRQALAARLQGTPQQQLAYLLSQGYTAATQKNQKAAAKAYVKGIAPQYWNRVATHNAQAAAHAAAQQRAAVAHAAFIASHDPNSVAPAGAAPPVTSTPTPGGVTRTPAAAASPGLNVPGIDYQAQDPTAIANSQVNAQFDPQITSLAQALTQAQGQGTQDQTDIKAWYDALQKDLGATTAADTQAQTDALASHDAGQQGILNVLGGNAGAANSAAAFGAIDRGALEKLGLSRQNYDSALAPAFTSQRNDAALGQLNKDRSAQQDLASQLAAARTAKGQAFGSALANAQDTNLKNSIAVTNAKAQLALLPYQVQDAQLGVQGKKADLKMAGLQYNAQKLKNAALGSSASGPVPSFSQLNPEQLTGLQNQLLSQAVDSKDPMKLAHNPADVYQAFGAALRSMSGGQWDPQTSATVNKWRNNLIASRLPSWNRSHPKQQYAFKNGVLVKKK
jgi:hypothetical protein